MCDAEDYEVAPGCTLEETMEAEKLLRELFEEEARKRARNVLEYGREELRDLPGQRFLF